MYTDGISDVPYTLNGLPNRLWNCRNNSRNSLSILISARKNDRLHRPWPRRVVSDVRSTRDHCSASIARVSFFCRWENPEDRGFSIRWEFFKSIKVPIFFKNACWSVLGNPTKMSLYSVSVPEWAACKSVNRDAEVSVDMSETEVTLSNCHVKWCILLRIAGYLK